MTSTSRVPSEERYRILTTLTNETNGHQFSEFAEDIEDWLLDDDGRPRFGEIYRLAQREYGRCTSSVYVDTPHGLRRVGWFFVSRQHYEDTGEPYLRGAWVTIITETPPVRASVDIERGE
jgi:hypothetical protein